MSRSAVADLAASFRSERLHQQKVETIDRCNRKAKGELKFDNVQPSKECRDLFEKHRPQRADAIAAVSYEVGSTLRFWTNLRGKTYSKDAYVRQAVLGQVLLTVEALLPAETTVELLGLKRVGNRTHNNVIKGRIISISDATPLLESYVPSGDIVEVQPFVAEKTARRSCHTGTRRHFKATAEAATNLLSDSNLVTDPLDPTAEQVTLGGRKRRGVYGILGEDAEGNLIIIKIGYSAHLSKRLSKYPPGTIMVILVDLDELPYDVDVALCLLANDCFEAIQDDDELLLCHRDFWFSKFYKRGGDRAGGRRRFIHKLVEAGLQAQYNLACIMEQGQWDDDHMFGMMAKVVETDHVVLHLIPRPVKLSADCITWSPADKKDAKGNTVDDYIYVTPVVHAHAGANHQFDPYPGPAIPNAIANADRYAKPTQHQVALEAVHKFLSDTRDMGAEGCANKLNKNSWLCSQTDTDMMALVGSYGFELKADIYGGAICLHRLDQAMLNVHNSLCRSGDVRGHVTLESNAKGCLVVETLRHMTLTAKGEDVSYSMRAIEAAMHQRVFVDGLNIPRFIRGAVVKECLSPEGVNAFDQCRSGDTVIHHKPFYPTAQRNRFAYNRKI